MASSYGVPHRRIGISQVTAVHWRHKVADPGAMYRQLFPRAKHNADGWALVCCPFHADQRASLSINFVHGGWRCFANCGSGDLVAFTMRHDGVDFVEALRILGVSS